MIVDYDMKTCANLPKPKILFLKPDINHKDPDDPMIYMAKIAQKLNNDVEILTTNCEKKFIDEELKCITVHQIGKFIPKQIFGWGRMIMYFVRMFCMIIWLIIKKRKFKQAFIVTHNSVELLPFLKLIGYFNIVLIYTFDDDELLEAASHGILQIRSSFYNVCLSYADKIIVHDKLSRTVLMKVFRLNKSPFLFYPCMTGSTFEKSPVLSLRSIINVRNDAILLVCFGPMCKNSNFELCVEAYSILMAEAKRAEPFLYYNTHLIIASHYETNKEHVEYYRQLKQFTYIRCHKKSSVIFLDEVSSSYQKTLISKCAAVVLPMVCFNSRTILQAGLMKKPVIALNGGIATEYIENGINGLLSTPIPLDFAKCMAYVLCTKYANEAASSEIFVYIQRKFGLHRYFSNFKQLMTSS